MKRHLLLVGLCVSVFANAKTTVEFDLKGEMYPDHKLVEIKVAKLNKQLKKLGLDGLPERIIVSENAKAYHAVLMKRIVAAADALKEDLRFVIDSGYWYEYPEVCYRGSMSGAVKVLDAMNGNFFTNEQGILAIRYGSKKEVRSDYFKTEKELREIYGENAPQDVENYLNYDTDSKTILVMSDLGPQGDGTELYSNYIKPCK